MIRGRASVRLLGTALELARTAAPRVLAVYVAVGVVGGLAPVATVWFAKVALDAVTAAAAPAAVWTAAAALAGAGLATAAVAPLSRYLQAELGRAVASRAKERLYAAVTGVPLLGALERPEFRDRLRLAEQASRNGPGQVVDAAVGLVQAGLTLVGMLVAVAVIAPLVAGALVLAALPALLAELDMGRRRADSAWTISPAERREFFYTDLLTNLSAAKELRLYGLAKLFRRRMLDELATTHVEQRRLDRREGVTQVVLAVLAATVAGLAVAGTLLVAAGGGLGAGDVAAVVLAVGALPAAVSAAVGHVAQAHHAGLLLEHYRQLVAPPAVPPPRTAPVPRPGRGIELDDVWFRYGDELPWVLRGVSLTLAPAQAVALVGENGSGKSTLVKLLCRFYDPVRGAVRWDGVDLRDIPLPELHARVAAVFQDFMSYELSAAENIAVGDAAGHETLQLDAARLEAAARRALVHDALAALPGGYATLLSRTFTDADGDEDGGVLLSGGQWQRLALARALLRADRPLLLLDEASAGLDPEAEHRVHREVRRHRAGRTSVLVSHRLGAVRDADRIVVLAGGRVVEDGDHDTLVAACGVYARLFAVQAAGYGARLPS